jgi:hypothetical protein
MKKIYAIKIEDNTIGSDLMRMFMCRPFQNIRRNERNYKSILKALLYLRRTYFDVSKQKEN